MVQTQRLEARFTLLELRIRIGNVGFAYRWRDNHSWRSRRAIIF
jgi:hypothetical protein